MFESCSFLGSVCACVCESCSSLGSVSAWVCLRAALSLVVSVRAYLRAVLSLVVCLRRRVFESCSFLHDLKGYLGAVLRKLPAALQSLLKVSVGECLDALWMESHLYGCDLRNALVQVAHISLQTLPLALLQTVSLA